MTISISIHCTGIARTLTLTHGLLLSRTKAKLRMMETWKICLISSLEEAELPDHDLLNLWTCLYLIYCFVMLFCCDDCLKRKTYTWFSFWFIFVCALMFDGVVLDYNFVWNSNLFLKLTCFWKKQPLIPFENVVNQNTTKRDFEKICILRMKIMKDFSEYQMDSNVFAWTW